jgi:hypothetical protein
MGLDGLFDLAGIAAPEQVNERAMVDDQPADVRLGLTVNPKDQTSLLVDHIPGLFEEAIGRELLHKPVERDVSLVDGAWFLRANQSGYCIYGFIESGERVAAAVARDPLPGEGLERRPNLRQVEYLLVI